LNFGDFDEYTVLTTFLRKFEGLFDLILFEESLSDFSPFVEEKPLIVFVFLLRLKEIFLTPAGDTDVFFKVELVATGTLRDLLLLPSELTAVLLIILPV